MSGATRGDPNTNTETSESAPDSKTTQPSTHDSDAVQPKPAQESDKEIDGSNGDKVVPDSVEKMTDGNSGDKEVTEPVEKGTDRSSGGKEVTESVEKGADGSSVDKEVTETVEKETDGSSDDKEVTEPDEKGTDKSDDTPVDKKESDSSDSIAKTESVVSSNAEKSDSVKPSDSTGGKIADNEGTSDARVETIATRYADLVASSEAADSAQDELKLVTHTAGDTGMLASIIRTISPGDTVTSVLEGDAETTEPESPGGGGDIASDTPAGGSIISNNPDGENVISNKPTGDGNITSSKPVSGNIISNNPVEGNVNANKLVVTSSAIVLQVEIITEDSDADSDNYDEVHGWLNHLQETLVLSVPHAANILIHLGPEVIAALYLGTLGHAAFGSAALATAYMSITGNTWGISLISALDTLASPLISMNEAQGYESQALQRTWLLLLVMSLPITFLWLCSYQVLTLVGVDSVIADQAADYCRFSLPGLWGMFLFESLKKVVQGTGADGQAMIKTITIFATLWMIVVGWFLVTSNSLGMGYVGVAITRAGMWWMMAVWAGVYLVVKEWFKANWTGWSHEAFYEWSTHLWLSGSCLMIMVTELWPVELIVVVAGCMDSRQLAVAGIFVQFLSFGSVLPFAISVSSTQRIDTFMRKAVPSDCQRAAVVSSLTILLFDALYCLALYLLRYQAPRLFTVDSSTIVMSTEAILYMNVYLCVDALLTSCRNVLRTFHRQQITFLLNVVCNYILGMPLALLFAFKFEDDLQGLYKGMSIGAGVQCGILVAVAFYFSDWNTEIWRLHARLNGETVKEWYDDEEDDEQHQLPTHVNGGTYGTHTA
ncbi:hypothetical protein SARC_05418 [Sphaeroforma arctica JP610]|uniref:Uncharacterized protein n=1 Tax=Sphaeroforma arctica JP610 TaxID=667725 RepID=A0A0L0G0B9_9EUKA|nr:hypothetical protein SARC_05418 [Sphaeroforma arctica JP610]KNC82299.1 hypothetical protein SARC_05418 [Sphaeroforma arctica JP610]|eukprot:XP_014156201.1 hypothetical protein SARC_05418 [Sphaeroforma arctica JP610]